MNQKTYLLLAFLLVSCLSQTYSFQNTGCAAFDAQNTCISCKDRYYMYSYLSLCLPVSPICKDYNTTTGACITCIDGFAMTSGTCQPSFSMIPVSKNQANCATFNNVSQACEKCNDGFVLLAGACLTSVANCDVYQADGKCAKCLAGYTINGALCAKIQIVTYVIDANCKVNDGFKCTQCNDGYMLTIQYTCVKTSPLCSVYSPNGVCTAC